MDERIGSSLPTWSRPWSKSLGKSASRSVWAAKSGMGRGPNVSGFTILTARFPPVEIVTGMGGRGDVTITRRLFHRPQLQPTDAIDLQPIHFNFATTTLPKKQMQECGLLESCGRWFGASRPRWIWMLFRPPQSTMRSRPRTLLSRWCPRGLSFRPQPLNNTGSSSMAS